MGLGIDAIQKFNLFNTKPVQEREAGGAGRIGGNNFFVNPGTELTVVTNGYGISIPKNHSYTTDTDGKRVAMGQDGVGLAHRNPEEYQFHAIG